ncbi:MAG TPA: hypothetical protein VMZ92_10770 [Planctomycetota bacterium]|nr:hypothetical protein [Planctomycetota bacterium]
MNPLRRRDRRRVFLTGIAMSVVVLTGSVCRGQESPAGLVEKRVKSLGAAPVAASHPDRPTVPWPLCISPDGDRLAYVQRTRGGVQVVCDGKPEPAYTECFADSLRFSPDGKYLTYGVRDGDAYVVVCGTKKIKDSVFAVFSPDRKHTALLKDTPLYYGSQRYVLDGKEIGTSGWPLCLTFSPNSKLFAWASEVRIIGHEPYRYVKCVDGKKTYHHRSGEECGSPVFSADSRALAYRLLPRDEDKDKWVVVLVQLAYDKVDESPPYDEVGDPVLSRVGRHLAYRARIGEREFVVRDGKIGRRYPKVTSPVFSWDAKSLLYWAREDDKTRFVCDEVEGPVSKVPIHRIQWQGLTGDGKHLVCRLGLARRSATDAYATDGAVMCDGVVGPRHDRVLIPERFGELPGRLRYVVVDDGEAWLVEASCPEGRTWRSLLEPATDAPAPKAEDPAKHVTIDEEEEP